MTVFGKKIWFVTFLLLTFVYSTDVFAAGLMNLAASKTVATFNSVKGILFVVGGFGLVGITFAAIFGKLRWKWLAGLGLGLAMVAAAGAIVSYSSGDRMDGMSTVAVVDTFGADVSGYGGGSGSSGGGSGGGSGSGSSGSWWNDFWNAFIDGVNQGYNGGSGGGSGGSDFSGSDLRINM